MIDKKLRGMLGGFLINYATLEDAEEGIDTAISQIKALYKPLLDALQDLYDEQNGPPLIRDKDSWEKAMEKAKQAIINARGK